MSYTQKYLTDTLNRATEAGIISSKAYFSKMQASTGWLFYREPGMSAYGFSTSAGLIRWLAFCIEEGRLHAPTKAQSSYRNPHSKRNPEPAQNPDPLIYEPGGTVIEEPSQRDTSANDLYHSALYWRGESRRTGDQFQAGYAAALAFALWRMQIATAP